MIYISTGGFRYQPAWKTCEDFLKHRVKCIELSGGLAHRNNIKKLKQLKTQIRFQVHNYFPPPEKPFVFNLASLNDNISQQSINHAMNGIHSAKEIDSNVYSFHAGFLLDPKVGELNNKIYKRTLFERKVAIEIFIERVNSLADYANNLGVELLIENNVLSENNHKEFQENPILMADTDECIHVMENTATNVNLLIDVAHLNVSAKTLKFDRLQFLADCEPWIKAYHLSDNDGKRDSNEPVTEESWFWPYLKRTLDYYSLEIYNVPVADLAKQKELTEKMINLNI